MERWLDILTVLAWASSGCGGANMFGVAMGLHPMLVLILSVVGECFGALIFSRMSTAIYKRFLSKNRKILCLQALHERIDDLWFGLLSPFVAGGPISAIIAVIIGVKTKRFYFGLLLGIVFSGVTWNLIAISGVDVFVCIKKIIGLR